MKLPCISLWQPWASLMAWDFKRIETRGRPIRYRGPLGICSTKLWNGALRDICRSEPFRSFILKMRPNEGGMDDFEKVMERALPRGFLLCVVDVVGCDLATDDIMITAQERAFGLYGPGRYGWLTKNCRRFVDPIPVTGRQGFFTVDVPEGAMRYAA